MRQVLQLDEINAVVVDDGIGTGKPLGTGGLLCHDAFNFWPGKCAARHYPLNLGFGLAVDHAHPVDLTAPALARFDQQRHIKYQAVFTCRQGSLRLRLQTLGYQRMNDGFKLAFGLRV